MKILLIDDNKDLCAIIEKFLEGHGHDVIVAYFCENAIQLLKEGNFDAVITNIETRDCSKHCVIDEIEKSGKMKEIGLVVLSERLTPEDIEAFEKRGVDFCFSKPASAEVLLECINIFQKRH